MGIGDLSDVPYLMVVEKLFTAAAGFARRSSIHLTLGTRASTLVQHYRSISAALLGALCRDHERVQQSGKQRTGEDYQALFF